MARGEADSLGPYKNFDEAKVANSLTGGALRGPGKLAVPPMAFARHDESEAASELQPSREQQEKQLTNQSSCTSAAASADTTVSCTAA